MRGYPGRIYVPGAVPRRYNPYNGAYGGCVYVCKL